MTLPDIDADFLVNFLTGLLNTPSPTGFTYEAIQYTEEALGRFPFLEINRNRKGALMANWTGKDDSAPRALTAHIDTLGAMVREIKPNGRLKMTRIGGYAWNTIEGEGCTVFTNGGEKYRGSILLTEASTHIHGQRVNELKREDDNMEVRLDVRTRTSDETLALGIQVGDFIAFDPRVEITNGFIRSRHLDDKACVACMIAAIHSLSEAGLEPNQSTTFHISNFEEVGHGASTGIPAEVVELISLDMAAVGSGQNSDEFNATLCVKDSGGPYHHQLGSRLRRLADDHQIGYKLDIYPFYGSDGGAFWRAGGDVAVALIGPGIDASHNYERTHLDSLLATTRWVMAYLLS
jgi:putative aminopeptidase FrvX